MRARLEPHVRAVGRLQAAVWNLAAGGCRLGSRCWLGVSLRSVRCGLPWRMGYPMVSPMRLPNRAPTPPYSPPYAPPYASPYTSPYAVSPMRLPNRTPTSPYAPPYASPYASPYAVSPMRSHELHLLTGQHLPNRAAPP